MFDKLIGAQIVSVHDDFIRISLNGKEYDLELESDGGDCCGYGDFETRFLLEEGSERNPIITDVELHENGGYDSDFATLVFYGEDKAIAEVEASAGSGSGWHYGAWVSISCSKLDIDEMLASW
jgi:hypothetical protein